MPNGGQFLLGFVLLLSVGQVLNAAETGGGSAAWTADGSGILYTRYPAQVERPEADLFTPSCSTSWASMESPWNLQ